MKGRKILIISFLEGKSSLLFSHLPRAKDSSINIGMYTSERENIICTYKKKVKPPSKANPAYDPEMYKALQTI